MEYKKKTSPYTEAALVDIVDFESNVFKKAYNNKIVMQRNGISPNRSALDSIPLWMKS